jgi:hypothetical protein
VDSPRLASIQKAQRRRPPLVHLAITIRTAVEEHADGK